MKRSTWPAVLLLILLPGVASAQASLRVDEMRVEHVDRPLGLHAEKPQLSWTLTSDRRAQRQTAYQIQVSSSVEGHGDVWDTGKVVSEQSVHVPYEGPPLKSRERYFWKVRVWDLDDRPSSFSAAAWWEMGLLTDDEWSAKWISATTDTMPVRPAPMFRAAFDVGHDVSRARLYITGLGYHEASLNGKKIGDHVLDPVATRYDRRVKYVVHDVTPFLRIGENVIGAVLGTGWYNQHTESAWDFNEAPWRAAPALLAQLEITMADGSRQVIATGETWRVSTGPIVFDGIRNGEHYDARLEKPGWDAPGYEEDGWEVPTIVPGPDGELDVQIMPPIRVVDTRYPVRIDRPDPATTVYDFGQNLTGRVHMQVRGPEGAQITIRYGERLFDDGTLDQRELSRFIWTGETQTDRYTLNGKGTEKWHPHFVYHGFQFAEVTAPSGVKVDLVAAEVLHTDFGVAGTFETSNPLINQIHRNFLRSYVGNYHGYPTDCPHREKIGWSGDAHLAAKAGMYNFDAARGYLKWTDDFADEQKPSGQVPGIIPTSGWGYTFGRDERYRPRGYGPAWEGAYVLIPWYLYQFTGDEAILARYYDGLRAYVDYLSDHADDHIIRFGIDDHKPAFTTTAPAIIQTGHYYETTRIVAEMARILGRNTRELDDRAQAIRDAYRAEFFEEGTYGNGGQTSVAGALYHGLTPPDERSGVIGQLVDDIEARGGHIDAGVVGTRYVLDVLHEAGRDDLAYEMATQTTYPGWGSWVAQGATTLWQNWDGTQSRNHVMFGSIGDWFYKALGGIGVDPDKPGFKRTIIAPSIVGDLKWVQASHASPYGLIESAWTRRNEQVEFVVTVPVNATGIVHVPGHDVQESGVPAASAPGVRQIRTEDGATVYEVGSGTYHFTSSLP